MATILAPIGTLFERTIDENAVYTEQRSSFSAQDHSGLSQSRSFSLLSAVRDESLASDRGAQAYGTHQPSASDISVAGSERASLHRSRTGTDSNTSALIPSSDINLLSRQEIEEELSRLTRQAEAIRLRRSQRDLEGEIELEQQKSRQKMLREERARLESRERLATDHLRSYQE